MTITSPMPVLRVAPAGPAPTGADAPCAPAGSVPELAAVFAAMVDALTIELAGVAGGSTATASDGAVLAEPVDTAEQAAATDAVLTTLLAATLQAAAAPAGTADPVAVTAGSVVEGGVAVGRTAETEAVEAATSRPDTAVEAAAPTTAEPADGTRAGWSGGPERIPLPVHRPDTESAPATAVGTDAEASGPGGAQIVDGSGDVTIRAVVAEHGPAAAVSVGVGPANAPDPQVAVVGGTAGVASLVPVSSVDAAPPAAAAPAAPAPAALPEQLVSLVAPLRRSPDGTHRMSLQLRPEELGGVTVDVRVLGNQISLHLRADLPATSELLRASLAELRVDLEAAGFAAGALDVGTNGRGAPHGDDDRGASGHEVAHTATSASTLPLTAPTVAPAAGIDIRL